MSIVFLVVMFLTADGTSTLVDGWYPRIQPSMEVCLQRKEYMQDYFARHFEPSDTIVGYEISCES